MYTLVFATMMLSPVGLEESPVKSTLEIPSGTGFQRDISKHVHSPKTGDESDYFLFLRSAPKSGISISIGVRRSPKDEGTLMRERHPVTSYLNDRRSLPSGLSIGEEGWTPRSVSGSMQVTARFQNVFCSVNLNYSGKRVNGKVEFPTHTWEEDLQLVENVARRGLSTALLWNLAGVGASTELQRKALTDNGYSRLGLWMTSKGFTVTWDGMKRMATFTKGNQKIKLAEGSREGFDGSTRKDHGHLIIGFQGELWAKTAPLTSWVD